jgi:aspartate 1-decarboxylase
MATVTGANIAYEGSITIDEDLLEETGIIAYEQVMVSNVNNGERFDTYVIPGRAGSGEICLNGPTARKGAVGDQVIIFCYSYYEATEVAGSKPKIIRLDAKNKIIGGCA